MAHKNKKYLYILKNRISLSEYITKDNKFVRHLPKYKVGITNDIKKRISYFNKEGKGVDMQLIKLYKHKTSNAETIENNLFTWVLSPLYDRFWDGSEWFYEDKLNKLIEYIGVNYVEDKILKDIDLSGKKYERLIKTL